MQTFSKASDSFKRANPHLFLASKFGEMKSARAMNKTEAEFARRLATNWRAGVIDGWAYESVTLKIADRCRYTPDFIAWTNLNRSIVFYEIKGGFARDDAIVKFKAAREMFKWAEFQMWSKNKGVWKRLY